MYSYYALISKHFMFTVNEYKDNSNVQLTKFQNISCLRLIDRKWNGIGTDIPFQNISCLRLIEKTIKEVAENLIFQNISCLRLIVIFPSFIRL